MSAASTMRPLLSPLGVPRMLSLQASSGHGDGPTGGRTIAPGLAPAAGAPTDGYADFTDTAPPEPIVAGPLSPAARATPAVLATMQPYVSIADAKSLAEFDAQYETLKTLGRGGEGCAVLVRERSTGALAVTKHAVVPRQQDRGGREALALPRINNPHVVRFRGIYCGPHPRIPDQATLLTVTDFVEGDSLADLVGRPAAARTIPFDEPTLWEILRQLQSAVSANERAGVVHADLHPGNIIITPLEAERFHVTAIDYGVSKVIDRATLIHVTRDAPARTAFHTPPELVSPDADDEYRFVRGTDRYFVGTTLLELMVNGAIPANTTPQTLLARLRGQINTPWSPALFDAIAGLIHENPANRVWPARAASRAVTTTATAAMVPQAQYDIVVTERDALVAAAEAPAAIAAHSAALATIPPVTPSPVDADALLDSQEALFLLARKHIHAFRTAQGEQQKKRVKFGIDEIALGGALGIAAVISSSLWALAGAAFACAVGVGALASWKKHRGILNKLAEPTDPRRPIYYHRQDKRYGVDAGSSKAPVHSADSVGTIFYNGSSTNDFFTNGFESTESTIKEGAYGGWIVTCQGRFPRDTHIVLCLRFTDRVTAQRAHDQLAMAAHKREKLRLHISNVGTMSISDTETTLTADLIHLGPALTHRDTDVLTHTDRDIHPLFVK